MRLLHIASLIGSNTNGIDYVIEKLLLHQNEQEGINAELVDLNNFSLLNSLKTIELNEIVIFHSIFSIKSWILIFYCLFKKIKCRSNNLKELCCFE